MKNKFWLLNGWMIVALFLVVFILYFMGVLEAFRHAKVDCIVGDGISCLETYVYTKEEDGRSKGNESDKVVFYLHNNLNQEIYNVSIALPNCAGKNPLSIFKKNETTTITTTKCMDLKPEGFFRSHVVVRYDVLQNNNSFSVMSKGYVSNFVNSPLKERIDKKVNKSVMGWIKTNVG